MNRKQRQQQRRKELAIIQETLMGRAGENSFSSTHNLDFEVGEWIDPTFKRFRIGTVEGLWGNDQDHYIILALINSDPGNGHFDDVLEWFEHSCRRDSKDLMVDELWNTDLKEHLITKRGFTPAIDRNAVVKDVRDM